MVSKQHDWPLQRSYLNCVVCLVGHYRCVPASEEDRWSTRTCITMGLILMVLLLDYSNLSEV